MSGIGNTNELLLGSLPRKQDSVLVIKGIWMKAKQVRDGNYITFGLLEPLSILVSQVSPFLCQIKNDQDKYMPFSVSSRSHFKSV